MAIDSPALNQRTNGRQRIIELGLDQETVAKRIKAVYQKALDN